VKLSTLTNCSANSSSTDSTINSAVEASAALLSQKEHLLCLNQQEALMLFGLLQAASRHEPTRRTILSSGDYKQFHRQLSQSLAQCLAS
jgi:hypothetical protein